jgi:hypothetical protein
LVELAAGCTLKAEFNGVGVRLLDEGAQLVGCRPRDQLPQALGGALLSVDQTEKAKGPHDL